MQGQDSELQPIEYSRVCIAMNQEPDQDEKFQAGA